MRRSLICRHHLPVALTLLIGTALTLVGSWRTVQVEQQRQALIHEQEGKNLSHALQQEVTILLSLSQAAGAFIATTPSNDLQQFRFVTKSLLEQSPSLGSMGWVDVIPHPNRPAYEQTSGTIVNLSPTRHLTPAPPQAVYFPLTYLQPLQSQLGVLGTDIQTIPEEFETLTTAQDRHQVQITPPLALDDKTLALIVYVPVFQPTRPTGDRPLRGFIRSVIQLKHLSQLVNRHDPNNRHSFYLIPPHSTPSSPPIYYDVDKNQLTSGPAPLNNLLALCDQRGNHCQHSLAIGDQVWQMLLLPNQIDRIAPFQSWQFWLTTSFGISLTLVLSLYLWHRIRHATEVEQLVEVRTTQAEQLHHTLDELQQTQAQLIQSEKMSSLGQLVAGIAHEINNPVNFIHGNLRHVGTYSQDLLNLIQAYERAYPEPIDANLIEMKEEIDLEFLREDLGKVVNSMHHGTDRIRQIVLSLRNFSRLDESELKTANLHDGIESTLMILQHRLKRKDDRPEIQILKQYGPIPEMSCYPGLLNQVIMNLLINAVDAIETEETDGRRPVEDHRPPQIVIQTLAIADAVKIGVTDNGSGMNADTQKSLFNPFFTTKPVGQGTGLGLSISYKIITGQHQGKIWVESAIGQGTTVWIELPLPSPVHSTPSQTAIPV
jgi:two-component system, NtrC family, sensor kinase